MKDKRDYLFEYEVKVGAYDNKTAYFKEIFTLSNKQFNEKSEKYRDKLNFKVKVL